jgi:Tol biopolymer transport system component
MSDVHPYRAEPDAAFADRLEGELLRRLAEPAGATSTKRPPLRKAPPTECDVNGIDVEVADGRRRPSRLHVVAGGLVAAGLVAALALVVGNTRDSQRATAPPVANGLIAFAVGTGDGESPLSDIYLVAPDGTGLRALTSTPDLVEYAPSWSPDGRRLAFVRTAGQDRASCTTAGCELIVVDPSTGAETFSVEVPQFLSQTERAGGGSWVPESLDWAPDGLAIAVTGTGCGLGGCGGQFSVIADLSTGTFTTFTPRYVAVWSPDGEWLALVSEPVPGPSLLLVPADADGTGEIDVAELPGVRTLLEGPLPAFGAVWMPDSSALLVSTAQVVDVGLTNIDVVTVADGERRTVIENMSGQEVVMVSPDGSQIAYRLDAALGDVVPSEGGVATSPESGDMPPAGPGSPLPVWVAGVDGSEPHLVTASSTPPTWSPDGNLLLGRDDQGWFTVRTDGTGRTTVAASPLPGNLDGCPGFRPSCRPSWQPLPPDGTPAEPPAVQTAMAFLDAYGAFDADRALSYLADEAIDDPRPVAFGRTRDGFRGELAILAAFRYRHIITGCEEGGESPAGTAVRCAFDIHEFGSDEVGLGPYGDNYWDLTVRDGKLTSARSTWAHSTNGSSDERWEPFANWVRANYPDDVLELYTGDPPTQFINREETISLLEQRVDEFVAEEVARLESARALIDAWVAGDGAAAAALFTSDGTWEGVPAEQLPALHDWLRAVGAEYVSDGCRLRPAMGDAECTYSVENDLTRFLDTGPIANSFVVEVADGAIDSVDDVPNEQLDEVWQTFADWMADNHPDDVESMYTEGTLLALLNATSIELWEQYVGEFVDAATAEITSTETTLQDSG